MKKLLCHIIIIFMGLFFLPSAKANLHTPAPKIIALGAPAVEILWALGFEQNIIARSSYDVWPPSILQKPEIGNPANPNLELLIKLKPDLIFLDVHFHNLQQKLEKLGFKTISIEAYYKENLFSTIEKIAEIMHSLQGNLKPNVMETAHKLIAKLKEYEQILNTNLDKISTEQRKKGIFLIGINNFFSFAKGSGQSFLQDSGANNLTEDFSTPYPSISREWLILNKPDFMLFTATITSEDKQERLEELEKTWQNYLNLPSLQGLFSLKKNSSSNQCIILNQELSYGLRAYLGNLYLAKHLYPQIFKNINPDLLYQQFIKDYFGITAQLPNIFP